jgi:hypothetical protein
MPLPKAQHRKHQHKRLINSDAYLRDDGLWDIEASMVDIKSETVESSTRCYIPAGEPFHDIRMRVTVDAFLKVQEVHASIDSSPFETCPNITNAYKKLIGTQIRPGWRAKIKQLVGGVSGCTHINELLPVIATTAIQALWSHSDETTKKQGYKVMIDSCHAWSKDGEVVTRLVSEGTMETED